MAERAAFAVLGLAATGRRSVIARPPPVETPRLSVSSAASATLPPPVYSPLTGRLTPSALARELLLCPDESLRNGCGGTVLGRASKRPEQTGKVARPGDARLGVLQERQEGRGYCRTEESHFAVAGQVTCRAAQTIREPSEGVPRQAVDAPGKRMGRGSKPGTLCGPAPRYVSVAKSKWGGGVCWMARYPRQNRRFRASVLVSALRARGA